MTLATILAVGVRSPLGLDARSHALALRASKLAPRRLRISGDALQVGVARCASLADDVFGYDRLVAMGAGALAECTSTSPEAALGLALHLAVPEPRGEVDARLGPPLLSAISTAAGVAIDTARSSSVPGGHAGFAVALEKAIAEARTTGRPTLAGAVDTYHDDRTLRFLVKEHRLHGPGVADGFIPSEGAAMVMVGPPAAAPALAKVEALHVALDRSAEQPDDPPIAVAMTDAVSRILDRHRDLAWAMVDVNGERARVKEWSFVQVRLRDRWDPERVQIDQPYVDGGETGAATGGLYTACACMAWQCGFAPANEVMIALHGDGPTRAALLLRAP